MPDNLQLTVTVDDPKFYTKPWTWMRANFYWVLGQDFAETFCIPSEGIEYRDSLARPSGIVIPRSRRADDAKNVHGHHRGRCGRGVPFGAGCRSRQCSTFAVEILSGGCQGQRWRRRACAERDPGTWAGESSGAGVPDSSLPRVRRPVAVGQAVVRRNRAEGGVVGSRLPSRTISSDTAIRLVFRGT